MPLSVGVHSGDVYVEKWFRFIGVKQTVVAQGRLICFVNFFDDFQPFVVLCALFISRA